MEGTFVGGGSGKGQQGYYCIYIYTHYVQYMSVYNYVYVCVYIYILHVYIRFSLAGWHRRRTALSVLFFVCVGQQPSHQPPESFSMTIFFLETHCGNTEDSERQVTRPRGIHKMLRSLANVLRSLRDRSTRPRGLARAYAWAQEPGIPHWHPKAHSARHTRHSESILGELYDGLEEEEQKLRQENLEGLLPLSMNTNKHQQTTVHCIPPTSATPFCPDSATRDRGRCGTSTQAG